MAPTALALLFGPSLFTRNIMEYCMEFFDSPYEGTAYLKVDNMIDGKILTTFSMADGASLRDLEDLSQI